MREIEIERENARGGRDGVHEEDKNETGKTYVFVDGNWENSPFQSGPRYPCIFANHSAMPNACFEKRLVQSCRSLDMRHRMLIVALETIDPGAEVRVRQVDSSAISCMHTYVLLY